MATSLYPFWVDNCPFTIDCCLALNRERGAMSDVLPVPTPERAMQGGAIACFRPVFTGAADPLPRGRGSVGRRGGQDGERWGGGDAPAPASPREATVCTHFGRCLLRPRELVSSPPLRGGEVGRGG